MIKVTDEMRAAVRRRMGVPDDVEMDPWMEPAIADVLSIVERQQQEAYGEAYQAGWWRGQHQLCPRCGVELDREVAAERRECQADGPDGVRCERSPHGAGRHAARVGEHLEVW